VLVLLDGLGVFPGGEISVGEIVIVRRVVRILANRFPVAFRDLGQGRLDVRRGLFSY
jgi:hypothetical protein